MKKKIYFFSSNRADFNLVHNIYIKFKKKSSYEIKFVITGKLDSLELDKNFIRYQFREYKNKYTNNPRNISLYINKFNEFFNNHKPDLIFLLGDRYETLGIAISAFYNFIKIAHISGGEETEGSMDNINRHLITKLSNLHFVYFAEYKKRIIQLGEDPKLITVFKPVFIESVRKNYQKREIIEDKFNFKFKNINALVTFHPITNNPSKNLEYLNTLLEAISNFKKINFIFTSSNHDGCGEIMNKIIKKYCSNNNLNSVFIENFGYKFYYSCLINVNFVMGNSSSGVLEAPLLGIPSINLGNRQKGRIKMERVIHSDIELNKIIKSVKKALSIKKGSLYKNNSSPSSIILNRTKEYLKSNKNYPKVFFDI